MSRLNELAISDTGFVFDPLSGATFTTNTTGLVVLQALKAGKGRDAIIAQLTERFETGPSDVHRDLDEFVHLLRRDGLVPLEFRL